MPSTVSDLVRALVATPPSHMSELERIVGRVAMSFERGSHDNLGYLHRDRVGTVVEYLSVKYDFDVYHQDPTRPRDVRLADYEITLPGERDVIEQILADKLGPPRMVTNVNVHDGTEYRSDYAAYPPWFVRAMDDGRPMLSWYRELPRFAMYQPAAERRRAWLGELARCCAAAVTVDAIDAVCKAAPPDAGIDIVGTLNTGFNPYAAFKSPIDDSRDYQLEFTPPVNALMLAEAFGWADPVGAAHDVHQSAWQIERRDDDKPPVSGAHQHWQVEARFTRFDPSGERLPTSERIAKKAIAEGDEIAYLMIGPRFR